MNTSKLKSSFAIDDILCHNRSHSNSIYDNQDINESHVQNESERITQSHQKVFNDNLTEMFSRSPKKPVPFFPPMLDHFYLPTISAGVQHQFATASYLEQYANALQKGELSFDK